MQNTRVLNENLRNQLQTLDLLVAEGMPIENVARVGPNHSLNDTVNLYSLPQWERMPKLISF